MPPSTRSLFAKAMDSRVLGVALILASLTADVILTILGKTVPSVVLSVTTAGIGMLSVPVWLRRPEIPGPPPVPASVPASNDRPSDPHHSPHQP